MHNDDRGRRRIAILESRRLVGSPRFGSANLPARLLITDRCAHANLCVRLDAGQAPKAVSDNGAARRQVVGSCEMAAQSRKLDEVEAERALLGSTWLASSSRQSSNPVSFWQQIEGEGLGLGSRHTALAP